MCDFVSWIEKNDQVLFLTRHELKTPRGQTLIKHLGQEYWNDIIGHGAIREYYQLLPDRGYDRECSDFTIPSLFPPEIVAAIKRGDFRGIGCNFDLLAPKGKAVYTQACNNAWAEHRNVAWAEHRNVAWAEYDQIRNKTWEEYHKANNAATAKYRQACDTAFWDLFAIPENRAEAWK